MALRYTDFRAETRGTQDFVIRHRVPTIWKLIGLFLASMIVTVSVLVSSMDKGPVIFLLCMTIGGLGWYVLLQIQRSRDLVLATEFQNALFASALGINNKFCLIIKREGHIVYMDNSFQQMFPDFAGERTHTIATLVKHGHVAPEDKDRIFAAIDQGVFAKVIFDIRAADKHFHRVVMSVEPIVRPEGFILLRGREFVETRASEALAPEFKHNPLLNKSSITLFSYIMDKMNMGVYMTDPGGSIIYANPTLEQWLSFQEGEVMSGNLSLKDIVYQERSQPGGISPDDFEGEVMLQKKLGGRMKAFINQKVIRSDGDKPLGCVALVHYIVERAKESQKKLW